MSIITNVRTIRLEQFPNSIWVEIETDENLTGLGEAWRGTAAIETIIHHDICPWLIGQDSRNIELISRTLLTPYVGFHSASAEVRAASAIDIALWDLAGKRHGIPVYEALGGASRSSIQVYNTCSGYSFNASSSAYNSGSSRRMITDKDEMRGPYDDQVAFNRDAGALAKSLLSEGYKIMKIWPFDPFAAKTQGNWISATDLEAGLKPFQQIRDAVGNQIEVRCTVSGVRLLPSASVKHWSLTTFSGQRTRSAKWMISSRSKNSAIKPEHRSAAVKRSPEPSPSARCSQQVHLITPCWISAGAVALQKAARLLPLQKAIIFRSHRTTAPVRSFCGLAFTWA